MPAVDTAPATPRGQKILVVEDDPLIRNMLCLALRRFGHSVIAASDGVEGAALIDGEVFNIDLLITDISLPGIRGTDLARKALAYRPNLKVVFASGSLFPDDGSPATLHGLPFLRKPFTLETVRSFINASFNGPGQGAAKLAAS